MINGIYKLFKPNKQKVQIQDEIVDAVVFIVRVTLIVGFVVGAICMGIIDRIVN